MRKYLYLLVVLFLCSGCASGYMTSSSYDSATGKYETKKYRTKNISGKYKKHDEERI